MKRRRGQGVRRLPGLGDKHQKCRGVADGITVPVLQRCLHAEVQARETVEEPRRRQRGVIGRPAGDELDAPQRGCRPVRQGNLRAQATPRS